jgi:hypothetical protein
LLWENQLSKKALQMEERFTKKEIETRKYEQREKALHDYYSEMKTSYEEGIKEVIQKMGSKGMSASAIAKLLDMTEDEVKKYLER